MKFWIWEQGGGYFGVPLTNYLGWFFTVYVFFQLFALYLRFRQPARTEAVKLPQAHFAQAVVMYAITGSTFVLNYLAGSDKTVTDATGAVWHTANIYETAALASLFTMLFLAALAAVNLLQRKPQLPAGSHTLIVLGGSGKAASARSGIAEQAK